MTDELKMLHNKYISPINKASGNVTFICQRRYAQVLIKELGLNNANDIKATLILQLNQ